MEIPSIVKNSSLKICLKKKGDLATAKDDGQLDTVSVGVDGTVLTADSSHPSGFKWVAGTGSSGSSNWGGILGNLNNQTDLVNALNGKEPANTNIQAHIATPGNPHGTTKTEIGLGSVTDEAQIPKSVGTSKGSLIAFSGSATPVEVPVGADTKVLTADATQPAGVAWKDAPAGTAAWGSIAGTLSTQGDLQTALNSKEPANANIQSHISSTVNPHNVTAAQVLPDQTGKNGKFLTSDGSAVSWGDPSSGTPPTGSGFRHVTAGVEDSTAMLVADVDVAPAAAITESKLSLNYPTHSNANDPTVDQKVALGGTSGTPGVGNLYVTDADPRNTNARTPMVHGSSVHTGTIGTPSQVGLGNVTNDAQIPKSLGTGKGSLVGFSASGTPIEVGPGTDGMVLSANSALGAGLGWVNSAIPAWSTITGKPHKTIGDPAPYNTLDAALAAIPPAGTTIIVPAGLDASARTLSVNRTLPAGVTLQVMPGAPIIINSQVRLTIYGTVQDCNYQIFVDNNIYDYTPKVVTGGTFTSGVPLVVTIPGHGFRDGEFVFVASTNGCGIWKTTGLSHNYWFVSLIAGQPDSFNLKGPDGNFVNGNGSSLNLNIDTILAREAWGVKFINSTQGYVRPEWWGAIANGGEGNYTNNNRAINHAINNGIYLEVDGWNVGPHLAVQFASGNYFVDGTLYLQDGSILRGVGMGWQSALANGTLITSKGSGTRFIYIDSATGCQIYDLNISGNVDYQNTIEVGTSGNWKSNNTRISRVHVGSGSAWAIYCSDHGMMTYIDNIEANPSSGAGGVHICSDSKFVNSRITGPDMIGVYTDGSVGVWSSSAMLQNNIIECCAIGVTLDDGICNHVQGNWIRQCGTAISTTPTGNVRMMIIGNQIGGDVLGIYAPSRVLNKCLIIGNKMSSPTAFDTQGFTDSIITGNDFSLNTKAIFNPASLSASGPGQFYNNIGIDVGAIPYLLTGAFPYRAVALTADKFTTKNTATTNYQWFENSIAPGRKLEIMLGDTYTTFLQFAARQAGQAQIVYGYTTAAGFSANNYNSASFTAFSSTAAVGDCLYVGDLNPLVGVKFWVNTPSIGNGIVAEYYDGYEWVTLTTLGANIFDKPGYQVCTWYPPQKNYFSLLPTNPGVTVDAAAKTFTLLGLSSWLQAQYPLKVGDYVITSGFAAAGKIRKVSGAPTATGTGYSVGDILTINTAGSSSDGTVRVDAVDGSGGVKAVSLVSAGTSYTIASNHTTTYGGAGTGCQINILNSGNNGKFKVTAITNNVLTTDDANLVGETKTGTTFAQAGWKAENNFNAIGLPWNPSSYALAYLMRFRVTAGGGGQCVIGDGAKTPQYSYLYLKNGDFGPTTDPAKKETITFKEQNGVFVEQSRTTVPSPGILLSSLTIAAGTTNGKMKSTVAGWLAINGVTYQKAISDPAGLWDLTALRTGAGEYCKVALCLDINGAASVVKGNVAASQATALVPKAGSSVIICGIVELGPNYTGGALAGNVFYDTPGLSLCI
ncbi:MAG: hypothetical protein WC600_04385 [Desulfobaccales bacterium]